MFGGSNPAAVGTGGLSYNLFYRFLMYGLSSKLVCLFFSRQKMLDCHEISQFPENCEFIMLYSKGPGEIAEREQEEPNILDKSCLWAKYQ